MRDLFQNRVFKIEIDLIMSLLGPGVQVRDKAVGMGRPHQEREDLRKKPTIWEMISEIVKAKVRIRTGVVMLCRHLRSRSATLATGAVASQSCVGLI